MKTILKTILLTGLLTVGITEVNLLSVKPVAAQEQITEGLQTPPGIPIRAISMANTPLYLNSDRSYDYHLQVRKTKTLAFLALRRDSENFNLYTVQANGLFRRQLTHNLSLDPTVVWSKNGKKLAFVSNDTNIYVVNADGSRLTQVLSDSGCKASSSSIAWALNDRKLVLTRNCDGDTYDLPGSVSLYVSDTTGIKGTKLIKRWQAREMPAKSDILSSLYLSPDGQQVVFFKDKNIYKMNTDGSGLIKLSNAPSEYPSQLTWSPDGREFAFSAGKSLHEQIYLVNVKKKTLKSLTNQPQKEPYDGIFSWSPNGTQLAYYHTQGRNRPGTQLDIDLLDINRGTVKKLTHKPGQYSNLTWSPDGKQIAFANGDFSHKNLYVMYIDSLKSTQIAPKLPLSTIDGLSWSSDSQKIAFVREEKTNQKPNNQSILYVVNRDGYKLMKLSNFKDVFTSEPTWKP
ncbi:MULTISPECIES: DPP IV N-terminal domain-containing protein [Nostoc]|uniref:PD40 domain-containing protein n=1 Tax=Nostoc paludosum FACHB-159 TaxID=2692908 RepID=A0ABR8KHX6_9NOSO|nr:MULTISPECIES: DPP IV N-terminal domain-containing protein [Nostoc]MBD2681319.1 PD40 domain-containing protein [Nostoc sp. FACHB-857]MBD2737798.1 PD40 domain-containing protein [Nostoc paludosum FACHB-159]